MAITSISMRSPCMLCRLTLLLLGIAGACQSAIAADEDKARQLLDEMTQAARTLNYDGVFVYQHDSHMDAMRIIHQADSANERERVVSLTGHAREVIRNDESVTIIFPDDQAVMVEKSRPYELLSSQLPRPIAKLDDYYDFAVKGSDRVAGRDSRIVAIQPRDHYRYGYRLWLDKKTDLMLRSELIGKDGKALEQFMFTRLEVVEVIPDSQLEPTITGTDFTWYENPDNAHDKTSQSHWQVEWLPAGFSMSNRTNERLADSPRPVHHMVFSDGVALVSVFAERISNKRGALIGPSRMGAVNAFARQMDDYQVVVVGEVPLITVRKIANAVSRQP
mgnify:CR=1 FL=1